MAHEITATDNMLSVRQMPWHGLGHVLDEHPTRLEAQALVHPWEPVEMPVFARDMAVTEEGTLEDTFNEIEDFKIIQRSDNGDILNVANSTYGLITNEEMWDVAEAVGTIGKDVRIETAGSLAGGRKVWVLLRLDEPFFIKNDPHGGTVAYLALQNAHDGSSSFRAQALNTRIVCANTSAAADVEAKRNGYEFTFRHSSKVADRIEDAKATVSMWRTGVDEWRRVMDVLADTRITPTQREEFVQRFQPMPPAGLASERVQGNVETARQQLRDILASETCEHIQDNAFGLFQAAIEWQQHVRKVKGNSPRARMESHFKRSMMSNDTLRKSTIQLVREVALV